VTLAYEYEYRINASSAVEGALRWFKDNYSGGAPNWIGNYNKFVYGSITLPYGCEFWNYWKSKDALRKAGFQVKKVRGKYVVNFWTREPFPEHQDAPSVREHWNPPGGKKGKGKEGPAPPPKPVELSGGVREKLFEYQIPHATSIATILNSKDAALDTSDTGTGKTYTSLAVAKQLGKKPTIICPPAVMSDWKKACEHFGIKDYTIVNWELARTGKKRGPPGPRGGAGKTIPAGFVEKKGRDFKWNLAEDDFVVFDEVHKAKNPNTAQARMVKAIADSPAKKVMLSATAAEDPTKMRVIGEVLGLFKGNGFYDWARQYGCDTVEVRSRSGRPVINPRTGRVQKAFKFVGGQNDIKRLNESIVGRSMARMRINELEGFPETDIRAHSYDLGPSKTNAFNKYYENLKTQLEEEGNPAAALVAMGLARHKLEELKVPVFKSLAEDALESGNSITIFVNYKDTANALKEIFGDDAVLHTGDVSRKDREEAKRLFQNDEKRIFISTIATGGTGMSLHDVNGKHPRVSLISPNYSAQQVKQTFGRVWRAGGKSKSVQRMVFIAGTMEEAVCDRVNEKLKNIDALNDGFNLRDEDLMAFPDEGEVIEAARNLSKEELDKLVEEHPELEEFVKAVEESGGGEAEKEPMDPELVKAFEERKELEEGLTKELAAELAREAAKEAVEPIAKEVREREQAEREAWEKSAVSDIIQKLAEESAEEAATPIHEGEWKSGRSKRSISMDQRQTARTVHPKPTESWLRDPAHSDVAGVDTKKNASPGVYVSRPVVNGEQFREWAEEHGVDLVDPADMHVTIAYSKTPFPVTPREDTIVVQPDEFTVVDVLGEDNVLALSFESPDLSERWREFRSAGADWSFPTYQPHVTLSYDDSRAGDAWLEVPRVPLVLGPEVVEPLDEDWEDKKVRENAPPRNCPEGYRYIDCVDCAHYDECPVIREQFETVARARMDREREAESLISRIPADSPRHERAARLWHKFHDLDGVKAYASMSDDEYVARDKAVEERMRAAVSDWLEREGQRRSVARGKSGAETPVTVPDDDRLYAMLKREIEDLKEQVEAERRGRRWYEAEVKALKGKRGRGWWGDPEGHSRAAKKRRRNGAPFPADDLKNYTIANLAMDPGEMLDKWRELLDNSRGLATGHRDRRENISYPFIPVHSSNVESGAFDDTGGGLGTMWLKFRGDDRMWYYPDTSDAAFRSFLASPSKGGWVWDHLRGYAPKSQWSYQDFMGSAHMRQPYGRTDGMTTGPFETLPPELAGPSPAGQIWQTYEKPETERLTETTGPRTITPSAYEGLMEEFHPPAPPAPPATPAPPPAPRRPARRRPSPARRPAPVPAMPAARPRILPPPPRPSPAPAVARARGPAMPSRPAAPAPAPAPPAGGAAGTAVSNPFTEGISRPERRGRPGAGWNPSKSAPEETAAETPYSPKAKKKKGRRGRPGPGWNPSGRAPYSTAFNPFEEDAGDEPVFLSNVTNGAPIVGVSRSELPDDLTVDDFTYWYGSRNKAAKPGATGWGKSGVYKRLREGVRMNRSTVMSGVKVSREDDEYWYCVANSFSTRNAFQYFEGGRIRAEYMCPESVRDVASEEKVVPFGIYHSDTPELPPEQVVGEYHVLGYDDEAGEDVAYFKVSKKAVRNFFEERREVDWVTPLMEAGTPPDISNAYNCDVVYDDAHGVYLQKNFDLRSVSFVPEGNCSAPYCTVDLVRMNQSVKDCVKKRIPECRKEHPDWKHDRVIAAAFGWCRSHRKNAKPDPREEFIKVVVEKLGYSREEAGAIYDAIHSDDGRHRGEGRENAKSLRPPPGEDFLSRIPREVKELAGEGPEELFEEFVSHTVETTNKTTAYFEGKIAEIKENFSLIVEDMEHEGLLGDGKSTAAKEFYDVVDKLSEGDYGDEDDAGAYELSLAASRLESELGLSPEDSGRLDKYTNELIVETNELHFVKNSYGFHGKGMTRDELEEKYGDERVKRLAKEVISTALATNDLWRDKILPRSKGVFFNNVYQKALDTVRDVLDSTNDDGTITLYRKIGIPRSVREVELIDAILGTGETGNYWAFERAAAQVYIPPVGGTKGDVTMTMTVPANGIDLVSTVFQNIGYPSEREAILTQGTGKLERLDIHMSLGSVSYRRTVVPESEVEAHFTPGGDHAAEVERMFAEGKTVHIGKPPEGWGGGRAGKGRGWWGDPEGHSIAAKKGKMKLVTPSQPAGVEKGSALDVETWDPW